MNWRIYSTRILDELPFACWFVSRSFKEIYAESASYQICKIVGCTCTSQECRERCPRHWLQRKPPVSDLGMHHSTCANPRWWGKRFRHSGCMRNAQFYVSGKGPMYIVSIKPASIFWGGRYQYSRYDIDLVFLVHSGQRCWWISSNYWNGSIHNMNHFSKDLYVDKHCYNKNIVRHTAHTIVSWPNPKQWLMIHTSGLMMIIR